MTDLSLVDIVSGYKGTDVLRGLSLKVAAGACVGVLGPNGAGKSTLLKTISGQVRVRSGSRLMDDVDLTNWRVNKIAQAGIRWVGDPRPIFPSLTVDDNLAMGGSSLRQRIGANRAWVYELMPMLRDKKGERAGSLSGGQQQMVAIGQALMSEPRFLCLDEPSLGLAAQVITSLSELIGELASRGVGIIWAEQFPEVAMRRCTEIVVLGAGKIILSGTPAEIDRQQLENAYLGIPRTSEVGSTEHDPIAG